MIQDFINQFADVVEVSPSELKADFDLVNGSAWDSLAFISTIALVDKFYKVVLDSDALQAITTFGELKGLIQKAG